VAADLPPERGDGQARDAVLINPVCNAIKFTDAGEVVIKAAATDGSFHLSVRDTGPGISAADVTFACDPGRRFATAVSVSNFAQSR
jgi:signal transduction histidine kinase